MRKNRRLGAMRTIVVKFSKDNVQMYSVTEERYNEILTYKYVADFRNWNLRTDVSYSFGSVFKMSDGLWYRDVDRGKIGKVEDTHGEAVYALVCGVKYEIPRSRYLSRTVEGVMQEITVTDGGKTITAQASVKWLSDLLRSFTRYVPNEIDNSVMCMPSTAKTSKTAAKRGKGFVVDKVINVWELILLKDPDNEFSR